MKDTIANNTIQYAKECELLTISYRDNIVKFHNSDIRELYHLLRYLNTKVEKC